LPQISFSPTFPWRDHLAGSLSACSGVADAEAKKPSLFAEFDFGLRIERDVNVDDARVFADRRSFRAFGDDRLPSASGQS